MNDDTASRSVPAYRVVLDNAQRITLNEADGLQVCNRLQHIALPRDSVIVTDLGDGPAYGLPPFGDDTDASTILAMAHVAYVQKLSAYEVAQLTKVTPPKVDALAALDNLVEVRVVCTDLPNHSGCEFVEVERIDNGKSVGGNVGIAWTKNPGAFAHLGPFYVKEARGAANRTQ